MDYGKIIAKRIEEICKERKITLNKLATLAGVRQSTLDNIIKGHTKNPKLKTLHRISVGLQMTVSQFLDFPEMDETIFEDE